MPTKVDNALLVPLFRLCERLPERYHSAEFTVKFDRETQEVVMHVGSAELREPRGVFPSEALITQMILVLP